jgi:hypothetical protein
MSNSSNPVDTPSEASRHVCPDIGRAACRASNRSSLTDIIGMRIKHMTTASVMAVAMDTLTVPRRTPKNTVARRTSESRIQTKLEKSSKSTFYAKSTSMHGSDKSTGLFQSLCVLHPGGGGR